MALVDYFQGTNREPSNVEFPQDFPVLCLHSSSDEEDDDSSSSSSYYTGSSKWYSCPSTPTASPPTPPPLPYSNSIRSSLQLLDNYCPLQPCICASASAASQPPCTPPQRSRRDKEKLHAARLQRSGHPTYRTLSLGIKSNPKSKSKPSASPLVTKRLFHQRSSSAPERPHDLRLARMAFAEQQRWITVQQKTFTKWCAMLSLPLPSSALIWLSRLNTKIAVRELEVKDLVADLSDGVRANTPFHSDT